MAVKVKCQVTGDKVDKKNAYKYLENGKKVAKYFTNEAVFKLWLKKKEQEGRLEEYRNKCYAELRKLLGVDKYLSLPIHIKTRVKKWSEQVGYNGVLYAIDYVAKSQYTMDKFNSHNHKINYMVKQVENNLMVGSSTAKAVFAHAVKCNNNTVNLDYIDEVEYHNPRKCTGVSKFL